MPPGRTGRLRAVPQVRLALAQMNVVVGDLLGNAAAIRRVRAEAAEVGCDLVLTPELALTGYPPEDLLLKEGFVSAAAEVLREVAGEASATVALVGVPLRGDEWGLSLAPVRDGRYSAVESAGNRSADVANAVAVLADGNTVAVATKRLLPNYDVFDEQRYFHPGADDLTLLNVNGAALGVLVCEDVWTADGPAARLAAAGASCLLVANASPYAKGRREEREAMLAERARETGCWIAYVNLVGGQDELVFDGQSVVVAPNGDVVARGAAFDEELVVMDLDLPPSTAGITVPHTSSPARPAITTALSTPLGRVEEIYRALVTGTRDYLAKNRFSSAVIALSGGVDSTLVAAIAVDALGPSAVRGFAMPSRYSSDHSIADAYDLASRLGIVIETLPIEASHVALSDTLAIALPAGTTGLTDENLQSRIRGVLLMAISNDTGAIVLTTGNKSEMATGYSTLYGDSAGGFAVIKDVPKTLVYELCGWRNTHAERHGVTPPIPQNVLEKPPSAELRPDQRDDQSLPPYDVLDPLLEMYVEGDATAEELIAAGHDAQLVMRIVRLVDLSEYKRRQMPPGVRVSSKAFGRDRRMPITNAFRSTLT